MFAARTARVLLFGLLLDFSVVAAARAQFESLPPTTAQPAAYSEPFNPPFPPWDQGPGGRPQPPIYTYPVSPDYVPPVALPGAGAGPSGCEPSGGAAGSFAPLPNYDGSSAACDPNGSPYAAEQPLPLDAAPVKPSEGRDGVLQRFAFIDTWLPSIGPQGQENFDLELYAMLGIPIPSRESPLLITPGLQTHNWDNLGLSPNLPSDLYDAYAEILWLHKWSDDFETYAGVTPGWHGDWQNSHEKAWRLEAQVIGNYTYSPTLKLVLGLKYLDRPDVWGLPIAGFIWTPNDDVRYEAVFPKPKLAHRFLCTDRGEYWFYYGGELGGGIWGMVHTDGQLDVVYSKDYRLLIGIEDKMINGWTGRLEFGFVFGRKIQFESGLPQVEPADTLLVRTAIVY
ncbi:MAG TPA: hypothetical protein VFE24_08410 [Pirellulales bacterium]|nr:hypothetical protein [Pirellulales bacterium]